MSNHRLKETKEGAAIDLFSGTTLASIIEEIREDFPDEPFENIQLHTCQAGAWVQITPVVERFTETEEEWKARLSHAERIEHERAICQVETEREHRRQVYLKLKEEFENEPD